MSIDKRIVKCFSVRKSVLKMLDEATILPIVREHKLNTNSKLADKIIGYVLARPDLLKEAVTEEHNK